MEPSSLKQSRIDEIKNQRRQIIGWFPPDVRSLAEQAQPQLNFLPEKVLEGALMQHFAPGAPGREQLDKQFLAKGELNIDIKNNPLGKSLASVLRAYAAPANPEIQLVGTEEERKEQLDVLKKVVGEQAGRYLYEDEVTDKRGRKRYVVGIYANRPGQPAFEQSNGAADRLGEIIMDAPIQQIRIVPEGATTPADDGGHRATIGTLDQGLTPGHTAIYKGVIISYILDPNVRPGYLPGKNFSDGRPSQPTTGELAGHELGHGRAFAKGDFEGSRAEALDFENAVRTTVNHKTSIRVRH